MEPCIPTDNSLANPSIYTTVLHTLTCILVPVNLFGAYCILFKTPKKMEAVKWLMLSLHCFSFLLDFSISFLSMPYVLFPVQAGYALGFWDNTFFPTYLIISLLGGVGVAIAAIFENRYYVLFGKNTWWEKVRKPLLILNHLLIPLFILPPMLIVPDLEVVFPQIRELLPCTIHPTFQNRKLFIFAVDLRPFVLSVVLMTTWNCTQIGTYFFTILFRQILRTHQSTVVSTRTSQMQRKFLIALSIQTSIPFTVLFIPISYVSLSIAINYHNQIFNNLVFIIFSLHGILSSTVMISVHDPYREFARGLAYRLIRKNPRNRVVNTIKLSVMSAT